MPNYATIGTPSSPRQYRGGYKDTFLFAPIADFTAVAAPSASPSALGDKVKITTAHTFPDGKGFHAWESQQKAITLKGESVGDAGARLIKWTGEIKILGDSASTQEQLQNTLNDKLIVLLKDARCVAGEYVQLGDDCVQPEFTVAFDSQTPDGYKVYTVSFAVTDAKYFYSGAIVEI